MLVQFLKDVTVDCDARHSWEERSFRRFDEVNVDEIIPASKQFSHLVLTDGIILCDVPNNVFKWSVV